MTGIFGVNFDEKAVNRASKLFGDNGIPYDDAKIDTGFNERPFDMYFGGAMKNNKSGLSCNFP